MKSNNPRVDLPKKRKLGLTALGVLPAPAFVLVGFAYPEALHPALVIILVAAALGLIILTLKTPCHQCGKQLTLERFSRRDLSSCGRCDPTECASRRAQG